jgi:formiminotetrahydrofolate cyclodeaminase
MPLKQLTLDEFCAALAARTPVPGGGAVAATVAAQSAALLGMVLEFTVDKPAHAQHDSVNRTALERVRYLRARALDLADVDSAAYAALNTLWKLPKDSPARASAWDGTVMAAIDSPQSILMLAAELARLAETLKNCTNPHLASDLAIAHDLAHVAARAAAHNVRVNLPSVNDPQVRAAAEARMRDTLAAAGAA